MRKLKPLGHFWLLSLLVMNAYADGPFLIEKMTCKVLSRQTRSTRKSGKPNKFFHEIYVNGARVCSTKDEPVKDKSDDDICSLFDKNIEKLKAQGISKVDVENCAVDFKKYLASADTKISETIENTYTARMSALKKCKDFRDRNETLQLVNLFAQLNGYTAKAVAQDWTKYPKFELNLTRGRDGDPVDEAIQALALDGLLGCKLNAKTLVCAFGIGPSGGGRFREVYRAKGHLSGPIEKSLKKAEAKCGAKDTSYEEIPIQIPSTSGNSTDTAT